MSMLTSKKKRFSEKTFIIWNQKHGRNCFILYSSFIGMLEFLNSDQAFYGIPYYVQQVHGSRSTIWLNIEYKNQAKPQFLGVRFTAHSR